MFFSAVLAFPFFDKSNPIITTPQGQFKGIADDGISTFYGIPYGQAPVGPLRFKHPQPAPALPAGTVFDATQFGKVCPVRLGSGTQTGVIKLLTGDSPKVESEDCLNLDLYAPTNAKNLPVIVFVFGGAFNSGYSREANTYDGRNLLKQNPGAVIVVINYRLGPFGWLPGKEIEQEGSLNAGLMDQALAFKWVRQNIAAFGGNPNQITAMGQSAGAISISLHMIADQNQKLFDRAILLAGAPKFAYQNSDQKQGDFDLIAQKTGCAGPNALECLRGLDFQTLNNASGFLQDNVGLGYGPTADKYVVGKPGQVYQSGAFSKIPVLLNANDAEGRFLGSLFVTIPTGETSLIKYFANELEGFGGNDLATQLAAQYNPQNYKGNLNDTFADAYSDIYFRCPQSTLAQVLQKQGVATFMSRNQHVPQISYLLGNSYSFHSSELPFVWQKRTLITPLEYPFANRFTDAIINFAAGKTPNPKWQPYGTGVRYNIEYDKMETDAEFSKAACALLQQESSKP
ncbi:Carboxylesterase [Gorgonomyces haynaldii]|nr:Carboxylesterase [Gorgonomyces haynaldii]